MRWAKIVPEGIFVNLLALLVAYVFRRHVLVALIVGLGISGGGMVLIGLMEQRETGVRKNRQREIRTRLGELLSQGDDAANAVRQQLQMIAKGREPVPQNQVVVGVPWGLRQAQEWAEEVETYLGETSELGESYVVLFNSQDGMPESPEKRPLAMENQLKQALGGIRVRQGRLRQFMDEFKG